MEDRIFIKAQLTAEGFNELFEKFISQTSNYLEAYEKAEEEHTRVFGRYRYSSYDSFRGARAKLIKN